MTSTHELPKTRCEIERKEKHTPSLVLSHMDQLVSADAPKKRVIEANYYVAEGDRGKASAAWENGHEATQVTTGDLEHAIDHAWSCAGKHGEDREH